MKRIGIVLTFFALFGLALAQGRLAELPADSRFDEPVEFTTGVSGESLQVMINALARSIGLTAVTNDVPPRTIVYDIGEPKPFRQVWNIVLTLYDLEYMLLVYDVTVVGSTESIARLLAPAPQATVAKATTEAEAAEQRSYRVNTSPEQVVGIHTRAVDGVE